MEKSEMISLCKNGDRNDTDNYQSRNKPIITITEEIQLEKENQGLRSCTDAVFGIRPLKNKSLKFNRPVYMSYCCKKSTWNRNVAKHTYYKTQVFERS